MNWRDVLNQRVDTTQRKEQQQRAWVQQRNRLVAKLLQENPRMTRKMALAQANKQMKGRT